MPEQIQRSRLRNCSKASALQPLIACIKTSNVSIESAGSGESLLSLKLRF
jgi:hypothetical protein